MSLTYLIIKFIFLIAKTSEYYIGARALGRNQPRQRREKSHFVQFLLLFLSVYIKNIL